jgi:hypothetical protein
MGQSRGGGGGGPEADSTQVSQDFHESPYLLMAHASARRSFTTRDFFTRSEPARSTKFSLPWMLPWMEDRPLDGPADEAQKKNTNYGGQGDPSRSNNTSHRHHFSPCYIPHTTILNNTHTNSQQALMSQPTHSKAAYARPSPHHPQHVHSNDLQNDHGVRPAAVLMDVGGGNRPH